MSSSNVIEIRSLVKSFGDAFTLGPLDLDVPRGAIFGLIGPNGAGKTTTIDLMLNMGREQAGSIRLFGKHHRDDEVEIKRNIGYVSPDINLDAWGKVKRLLHYFRKFYPDWDDAYCRELLDKLNVHPEDKIRTMSFGTKIKLNLIVALAHRPDLLLLDEPTMGLDAVSRHEVFGELLKAVQDEERTVLISSHGLADVERFADHIGFIKEGRLLLGGETAALVSRFRLCDFECRNGTPSMFPDGVYPQPSEGGRVRAVIDGQAAADGWIKAQHLQEISSAPMNLEELFVALAKE
jgi:ABC-2 type transport system ATP-binding protein